MSGLFSLATMMLFLVLSVVVFLGAFFLYLGAKLARIERVFFAKALLVTVAGGGVYGVLSFFGSLLAGGVPLLGTAVIGLVLAKQVFDTSYGKALIAGLVQVVALILVGLGFGSLPESVIVPIISTIIYQGPDPDFGPHVPDPAYTEEHPKVLLDEAHFNAHTLDGSYRGFADLIEEDGYLVAPNKQPFAAEALNGYDVLVIANARGGGNLPGRRAEPAFTEAECDAVVDWVLQGGSLLLIADHAPYGSAAQILSDRFGVRMSKGFTVDPVHNDGREELIVFSRDNGLLAEHPITNGRDASERLDRLVALGGQSLRGPPGGTALLVASDSAVDIADEDYAAPWLPGDRSETSAAGASLAIVLRLGDGRVVVLAEAAMLTAQVVRVPFRPFERTGLHSPGTDNQQFALNIMHWLSGLLD